MFKKAILTLAAIGLGVLIAPNDGKTNRKTVADRLRGAKKSVETKLRRK